MAIYVPPTRRRRNLILVGLSGVVLGAVLGVAAGRSSAPTVEDRVRSVRSEARAVASQLRVVSLHEEAGSASLATGTDAGAELALRRTETDLQGLMRRAPWVSGERASNLLADTVALRVAAPGQARSVAFGQRVDNLADRIELTFGGK